MNKTTIEELFKSLANDFDIHTPEISHEARFIKKLKNQEQRVIKNEIRTTHNWKPFIGIAASILLLITVALGIQQNTETGDLASISPKMAKTQDFFTTTLDEKLNKLKAESVPEVQNLVKDALNQITNFGKPMVDTSGIEVNTIISPVLYRYYKEGNWSLF